MSFIKYLLHKHKIEKQYLNVSDIKITRDELTPSTVMKYYDKFLFVIYDFFSLYIHEKKNKSKTSLKRIQIFINNL